MKKKNYLLLTCSVLITLLIVELILRLTGTHPGRINKFDGFKKVDQLILYKNFTTDETGIYKFSPWVTDSLLKYFDCKTREIVNPEVKNVLYDGDRLINIYESFCAQTVKPRFSLYWKFNAYINDEADTNCILNTHNRMLQNAVNADAAWKTAFAVYFNRPFNPDGFRSIPFKNYTTRQLKVLIIGDSFVYGMDAQPQQNSFTDILLARGYLIYAAGIPGTDPAQYAAIAKKYIPLLKPDVVISCFYTGNDFMKYEREPDVAKPHEHMTNAGLYYSAPYGKYLNPQDAYRYYLSLSTFPDSANRWFDKLCAYTSIGTLIWNACLNKGLVKHHEYELYNQQQNVSADTINARTALYTHRIKNICTQDSVPFIQAIIPDLDTPLPDTAVLNYLFSPPYYLPHSLNAPENYYKKGFHFNNLGSLKYANFLDSLLQPYADAKKNSTNVQQ